MPWGGVRAGHLDLVSSRGGHLECCDMHMRMDARGAGWDVYTCRSAARGGHLECLRYAHENGCPWGGATTCM